MASYAIILESREHLPAYDWQNQVYKLYINFGEKKTATKAPKVYNSIKAQTQQPNQGKKYEQF